MPAELQPLIRSINGLFERIARAVEHERRLTADAAHELRTPLAARLRAISRRARGRPEPVWQHGALEYNSATKAVRWRGEAVQLTSREAALLEVLLAHPGRILSKPQIIEKLYGWGEEIDSNALEVFVHHLRRKIAPTIVRTVRGMGYALGEPEGGTAA